MSGIKSCYDLKDILDRGTFVLKGSVSPEKVLVLQLTGKPTATDVGGDVGDLREESIDYLLDLRSKLLMTEIPPELEEEMQASSMVEAFVQQLQVLSEICDVIVTLHVSGHMQFQKDFAMRVKFAMDGLVPMQRQLETLQRQSSDWESEVKRTRYEFYYLNFYSMREILRFRFLLGSARTKAEAEADTLERAHQEATALTAASSPAMVMEPDYIDMGGDMDFLVDQLEQMGFARDWALVALKKTGSDIEAAIEFCFNNSQNMDRIVAEDAVELAMGALPEGGGMRCNVNAGHFELVDFAASDMDARSELYNLLHLVSSSVDLSKVDEMITLWREEGSTEKPFLSTLGYILSALFESSESLCQVKGRCISLPDDDAKNKADMLVLISDDSSEKRLPVFVACTESPLLVFDTVLSVYVRRGRLPEPGEIMFCTAQTVIEDVNLMFLRFISGQKHGREHAVFCIADVHNLSYTLQCALVEKLRILFAEHGQENAATLLLVSGLPRQVVLNTLSAHMVDLPPLSLQQLQRSCDEAFRLHVGPTQCVASSINGGGKTHYILNVIADAQSNGQTLLYRKVPFREGTTPKSLVELMSAAAVMRDGIVRSAIDAADTDRIRIAFHVDIAHIIPPAANTMLFQLLLVGVLRDPVSCRVYFRHPQDVYFIELPNSIDNKSITALRFCSMLPCTVLQVEPDTLSFTRPVVANTVNAWPYSFPGTRVLQQGYVELLCTCKWLRAINDGKILWGGPAYMAGYSPWTDADITVEECMHLLTAQCNKSDGPSPFASWAIFNNFVSKWRECMFVSSFSLSGWCGSAY